MVNELPFIAVTFAAIFVVVDPIGAVPLFLTTTQAFTLERRRATARQAAITCTITLLVFAISGGLIFQLLGISRGALRIAGGILLFLLSLDMLKTQKSERGDSPKQVDGENVAVVPLGIPMLAGPGSIATVTLLMSRAASVSQATAVIASVAVTGVITFLLFRIALTLGASLRGTALTIMNRLMGLFLTAIAIEFVVSGIRELFPQVVR